jgi:FkbM family methyltransferase
MMRQLLERMSRRVVLKRRLPRELGGGAIYVSPGAALNHWRFDLRKVDPMLFDLASELVRPGDVVWDIGANVGMFSFAAAALAGDTGRVLAVEADTWLVGLLRRSAACRAGDRAGVEIYPSAVSDRIGVARFKIAQRGRASNYLESAPGSNQTGGVREIQLVPTITLDWLLDHFPAPNLVKIDVEGAENRVFRGATRLLSEIRPAITCEIFEQNRQEVDPLLKGHGYTLYDAELPAGRREPLGSSATNTLACPPGWER